MAFQLSFFRNADPRSDMRFQKILKMFNDGRIEEGVNDMMIVLVPKVRCPSRLEDFRPISLCNVTRKIITKVLAKG